MTGVERIRQMFDRLKATGRKALIPYLTAGDPDLATTERLLDAVVAGGADLIELGVPFSDPMADGPVLQKAAERALQNVISMDDLLGVIRRFRARHDTPIILFGYYNPFFRYGHERLAAALADAGGCGVLCVDVPPEEATPFYSALRAQGLALVPLITPVSGPARVQRANEFADAFAYYVSTTGVTGLALTQASAISDRLSEVRKNLNCPLVVGFGVRTADDAARMGVNADGVVVGSALVQLAHEAGAAGPERVRKFVGGLKSVL